VPLAKVPASIADDAGRPRFGSYEGGLATVDFGALGGDFRLPLARRFLRQKRWHYTLVTTPKVAVLGAVVDLGYTANAFCCAVDLEERRVLADESFLSLPGPWAKVGDRPNDGLEARFRTPGASLSAKGEDGRLALEVEVSKLRARGAHPFRWQGALATREGPPPLTVVAPTEHAGVNVTQKTGAFSAQGTLEAGGRTYPLEGGVGGADYTQGLLARRTTWRWGFAQGRLADGTPLGLNLVEGFNDADAQVNENAAFVGQRLIPLARARFTFDKDRYLSPWNLCTEDGALSLTFTPLHVHHELRDYKVIKSKFVQVVGLFHGSLRVDGREERLEALPGVTEDQDVLW
jgi:hypothetical protein